MIPSLLNLELNVVCFLLWLFVSSAAACTKSSDFIGIAVTSGEFTLIIACIVLFALLLIESIVTYCGYKYFQKKLVNMGKELEQATSDRKQAKSFANALTNAYDTNVDATRIRQAQRKEEKNRLNEDYLQRDAYVNSDLPEDLRADNVHVGHASAHIEHSADNEPILNDHKIMRDDNNLLANQVIVPVVSDVSDDINRIRGPSVNGPPTMSAAIKKQEKQMVEITERKKNNSYNGKNNNNNNKTEIMSKASHERLNSNSPPESPRQYVNVGDSSPANNDNNHNNNNNQFNFAQQAAMAMEQKKKGQSPPSKNSKNNKWGRKKNSDNNQEKQNEQQQQNIPPVPPVPQIPPHPLGNKQQKQLLPQANNNDDDDDDLEYGAPPADDAAPAANGDSDDDIVLPPSDGFGVTGKNGRPPPPRKNGAKKGKQNNKNNENNNGGKLDVAMDLAMRMSVDEGHGGGGGGGGGQVEGLAKSLKSKQSGLLDMDEEDDFLDDMYAPVNRQKSKETPGDGDGDDNVTGGGSNVTPGGPGVAAAAAAAVAPPPKPIVEDDEVDVLDV